MQLFSSPSQPDSSELFEKKAQKKKNKKYYHKHKKNSSITITSVNTNNVIFVGAPQEINLVIYFNCNRISHYARNYSKLKRNLFKIPKN